MGVTGPESAFPQRIRLLLTVPETQGSGKPPSVSLFLIKNNAHEGELQSKGTVTVPSPTPASGRPQGMVGTLGTAHRQGQAGAQQECTPRVI